MPWLSSSDRRVSSQSDDGERIRRISPEGRPARPGGRGGTLVLFTSVAILTLLVVAVQLAVLGYIWFGITVAVLGLVFGILANPVMWAALLRVRERREVDEHPSYGAGQGTSGAGPRGQKGRRRGHR